MKTPQIPVYFVSFALRYFVCHYSAINVKKYWILQYLPKNTPT